MKINREFKTLALGFNALEYKFYHNIIMDIFTVDQCVILSILNGLFIGLCSMQMSSYKFNRIEWATIDYDTFYNS